MNKERYGFQGAAQVGRRRSTPAWVLALLVSGAGCNLSLEPIEDGETSETHDGGEGDVEGGGSPGPISGGSCIVSPFGELLAGPKYGEETIMSAEIDPAEIVRGIPTFDGFVLGGRIAAKSVGSGSDGDHRDSEGPRQVRQTDGGLCCRPYTERR